MEQEDFRKGLDEVLRVQGEIVRRLGQQGVRGVAELVELYERMRAALEVVSQEEIDAALVRIGALVDELRLKRLQLDRLASLRALLGLTPPSTNDPPVANHEV
jgi:hypothetical protein